MKNIEVKNITLMDEVETKEAEEIYEKFRVKYSLIMVVPILLFFISTVGLILKITEPAKYAIALNTMIILTIISLIVFIIGIAVYKNFMKPYEKLLEIAKLNDKIRHEEKIRDRERKRLQAENKEENKKTR